MFHVIRKPKGKSQKRTIASQGKRLVTFALRGANSLLQAKFWRCLQESSPEDWVKTNLNTSVKGFCRYNWCPKRVNLKVWRILKWELPYKVSPLQAAFFILIFQGQRFQEWERFIVRDLPVGVMGSPHDREGAGCISGRESKRMPTVAGYL